MKKCLAGSILAALVLVFPGCHRDSTDQTKEKMGEASKEVSNRIEEVANRAAQKINDASERAAKRIDDTVDAMTKRMDREADNAIKRAFERAKAREYARKHSNGVQEPRNETIKTETSATHTNQVDSVPGASH